MQVCRLDETPDLPNANYYGKSHLVKVSKQEALILIASLAEQLKNNNPNTGRVETRDKDGAYFSISVCEG